MGVVVVVVVVVAVVVVVCVVEAVLASSALSPKGVRLTHSLLSLTDNNVRLIQELVLWHLKI